MKKMSDSRYLILGAASKTGQSLSRYMSQHHFRYSISDIKPKFFIDYEKNFLSSSCLPEKVFDNPEQTFEQLDNIDQIIISPGIPFYHPLLKEAQKRGIPVRGEIAFCYATLLEQQRLPIFLGVTGSLGKSTTSFLLYQILKAGLPGRNIFLLGNFGVPLSQSLDTLNKEDIVVLELSSYQLEDGYQYHLHGATILNISPNHLDRYPSIQAYQQAKENIFSSQKSEDFAVFNRSHLELKDIATQVLSRRIYISSSFDPTAIYSYDEAGNIYHQSGLFLSNDSLTVKNLSILEDMCTALAMSSEMGVSTEIQRDILSSFRGLEHRAEWVGEKNHISFINDSKATTPFAILPHLKDANLKQTVLILGGKNKDLNFSVLSPYLEKIRAIVFYGKDGKTIQEMLPFSPSHYVYNFEQAVYKAWDFAQQFNAESILLSPGCTSYDQFSSFEERGKAYKTIVNSIIKL